MAGETASLETTTAPNNRRYWAAENAERACRLVVAVLLLRSSFAHLENSYAFLDTVYSYQIFSEVCGNLVALFLPFLQLVLGVCLLLRYWTTTAYLLSIGLLISLTAVQIQAMVRGLDIECGCFGPVDTVRMSWTTLLVSAGTLVLCTLGLAFQRKGTTG